jgi:hypothetical protein
VILVYSLTGVKMFGIRLALHLDVYPDLKKRNDYGVTADKIILLYREYITMKNAV